MGASEAGCLRVSGVDAGYDGAAVLRGVNAVFAAGRLTVVIGPNGAGKSTLSRVLAGVLRPKRGEVSLEGVSLWGMARGEVAARAAYVPQRSEVSEPMTAAEVVSLGTYASGRDEEAVRRSMERTGVWEMRAEMYWRLSVGQQQRVTLARALAQLDAGAKRGVGSQFVIADEPASAQDPKQVMLVMGCLREESRRGRGVVVVLHDLTLAARYADDAVVVSGGGKVGEVGLSEQVLSETTLGRVFGVTFRRVEFDDDSQKGVVIVSAEGGTTRDGA